MLVLSRKIDDKIMVGDDIEITVISVSGDNVRLGIKAPQQVKILRSEVYEEILKQNKEAALAKASDEASSQLLQMLSGRGQADERNKE